MFLAGSLLGACRSPQDSIAELWTDVPEFALYAAAFNTSQPEYRIHVQYVENLPSSVQHAADKPALVIGRYLKSATLRPFLQPLDFLFTELRLNERLFYPNLLTSGLADNHQLLLPVSFNLPMIIFAQSDEAARANDFTISLEELETSAAAFDRRENGSFNRMGYSPRWSPAFMMAAAQLLGADFRESDPIRWNRLILDPFIANLRQWIANSHGSAKASDDFRFRYLYIPEYKAIQQERIRFAWMESAAFFTLNQEYRSALSFRWFGETTRVRVEDDMVFAGLVRKARGSAAAEAFLAWFYREETQQALLTDAKLTRLMETSFGLAGGFSALRTVNENFFVDFYPALLGKLTPPDFLQVTGDLPATWPAMKRDVVLPFLLEATAEEPPADLFGTLDLRLRNWLKQNGL
ncbi:MAG: hypothetical protein A2087_01685 [Spirochaetes bacterium GWD1_61_31]|nr:MAG: hypothetical protein A2Y37_10400 [Spirochaetes bacterium GWB1_60_80]OHD34818.1 MAG: hypothetical protein A2004_11530 [Spirochaetes bacterium GWC1_61_12]OHD35790.1 MAG: hypothetical protein A2087_01685 [Spirochaetes bacterium GWD1_61_31]OHD42932.1 MAG: hypothetical protein A2Y35_14120 [Spirochaetes bacterium GWE1_60_18]OHD61293.1 MAG: hypothetical protein A2Y32_04095 [Spirochaetes bacterium GWF1_60_12]